MTQGWEAGQGGSPRRGSPGLTAAVVVAVVAVGAILARPASPAADREGALQVVPEPTAADEALGGEEGLGAGEGVDEPATPRVTRRPPPRATPGPERTLVPGVDGELAGEWRSTPAPEEMGGMDAAVAWDGAGQLFVVGGQRWLPDGYRTEYLAGAWLYDVDDDTWRELPPGPLGPRSGVAAAWTGDELVVWGGIGRDRVHADGAVYDPAADRWRALAEGPLSPRHGAAAIALPDGTVLLAGGTDHAGGLDDGGVLDPRTGGWSDLSALPAATPPWGAAALTGTAAGGTALLWAHQQWGPTTMSPLLLEGGGWEETDLGAPAESAFAATPLADGRVVGVHGRTTSAAGHLRGGLVVLAPGDRSWEAVGEVPLEGHGVHAVAALGGRLPVVLDQEGRAVAHDLDRGRWLQLPALRSRGYDASAMRTFPTEEGFVVFEPDPMHGRQRWWVHRFTPSDGG